MEPVATVINASLVAGNSVIVIVAGGDRPDPTITAALPPPSYLIAADSGVDHARSLDLPVDLVVGDLDSASGDAVAWARSNGATVQSHPVDKDQTDLELAFVLARRRIEEWGDGQLMVLGLGGGRLDHLLANVAVLAGPLTQGISSRAVVDDSLITVIRSRSVLVGRPDDIVTLLAVNGPADGVTTTGLVFPLRAERLDAGSARGVSNRFEAETDGDGLARAVVEVSRGTLVAVQPSVVADHKNDRGQVRDIDGGPTV